MPIKKLMNYILARRAENIYQRIAAYLPTCGKLLDIGCGTGHNASIIRKNTVLEIFETDVENLKTAPPAPVIFDGNYLPFETQSFGCSLLLFVLHYPENPELLLKEAKRVTTGNLIILQSTYSGAIARLILKNRDWIQGIFAFHIAQLVGLIRKCSCPLYPKTFMERNTLERLFHRSGWKIKHFKSCCWPMIHISRDLYVLEHI